MKQIFLLPNEREGGSAIGMFYCVLGGALVFGHFSVGWPLLSYLGGREGAVYRTTPDMGKFLHRNNYACIYYTPILGRKLTGLEGNMGILNVQRR